MASLQQALARGVRGSLARKSAAYVLKNYRFLSTDPSFFLMKTVARFEVAREWATRPAEESLQVVAASPLVSSPHDPSIVLETLRNEGYYVGLSLAPEVVAELHEHMHNTTCYGDRDPHLGFRIGERDAFEQKLGRTLKVASYFNQQLEWPIFTKLKRDPWLMAIARAYLGRDPVFLRSEIAWSFAVQSPTEQERLAAAQVLHCDINDFKTLKFFFYLSDVGPTNGPHAYIKKNPRKRTLMHQVLGQRCAAIPDEALVRTYDGQLVTICGPGGTGFAGDPYYFHRGTHPTEGSRALLQIELGCHAYRTWYFDV